MTAALRLGLIGVVVAALLAGVDALTKQRIHANQQRALVELVVDVTGDPRLTQIGAFELPMLICSATQTPLYRIYGRSARGYAGPIELLLGIGDAGKLTGVRVVSHRETPGIGDVIETGKSNWIAGFVSKTATTLSTGDGAIDVVSSASITTGAVIGAVHDALVDAADAPLRSCSYVLSE
jgi:electron transport complex protein RnfG